MGTAVTQFPELHPEAVRRYRTVPTTQAAPDDLFAGYTASEAFDEMFDGKAQPRRPYRKLHKELLKLTPEELLRSKQQADLTFFNQGITFTVYGRDEATERIFPHDLLPRIVSAAEWDVIERGLTQRITALNLFLTRHLPRPADPAATASFPARWSTPAATSAAR